MNPIETPREITEEEWIAASQSCCGAEPAEDECQPGDSGG